MRLIATTVISLRALRRNKLRSMLTALGIIIGVAAVIAMVSIGNGAKAQVEAQVASLGQNVITVFPGSMTTGAVRGGWGSRSTLTPEDADAIRQEVAGVVGVSAELRSRDQIFANGLNWNTQILGESPDYLSVRAWPLAQGEMFTEADVRSANKVVVIGRTVAEQVFGNHDPIGETLRIRNIPFTVVGVLRPKGFNFFGQDQDDTVIIPYSSFMKRVFRRDFLSSILIQAESERHIPLVQQEVESLLTQRRGGREPDFTVRSQLELAEAATATSKTMTVLLGAIAGVSLIVGGIGIMNIMLVSVTERTREIGIRLAVGAHGRDVLLQFLIEAIILSLLGGLIGVALGIGASQVVAAKTGWAVLVSELAIFGSLFVCGTVGVLFGFFPAFKASQLDPIDALRYE
jgi:putative ABC transport system permease protein